MTQLSELEREFAPPAVDLDAAARAAREFLTALGISCDSESMERTPRRMAEAYAAMLTSRPFEVTTFPNDEA
ncbi:MAG: cyclohydrolase, partial [Nocardioidaceae bacterium]|nr:cyclohydrolase [Nocardioidaceae bacterium]